MPQQTFAEVSFEQYRNPTRRERFLDEMTRVVPWAELVAVIEPIYPKAAGPGRPPVGVERMLRLHCLQQWFNLSDPAVEEARYDSRAMRHFVGIDLGREPVPDEPTICKFRHLLGAHQLGDHLFARIGAYLAAQGFTVSRGTIVDVTIISAPSSTKNRQKERDPEMHQTKKGNQWHFGMKAHIAVDADSGLVHTVTTTAANEADVEQVADLLHGKEQHVWADSGYRGAQGRVGRDDLQWHIATRPSDIAKLPEGRAKQRLKRQEFSKASVRAKVEHPFRVIKRQFGLAKVRFRGLAKNTTHVVTLFALSNLWMARRQLMAMVGVVRPRAA